MGLPHSPTHMLTLPATQQAMLDGIEAAIRDLKPAVQNYVSMEGHSVVINLILQKADP